MVVGILMGVVNFLWVDDNFNVYFELGFKMLCICYVVVFNMMGKLVVVLERVRNDNCFYIWDVNWLFGIDFFVRGFFINISVFLDFIDWFELSVFVLSVKFFEDDFNFLVVGIKGIGLRLYDFRDYYNVVIMFWIGCCNNFVIDYVDLYYFVFFVLDKFGVMVWDWCYID